MGRLTEIRFVLIALVCLLLSGCMHTEPLSRVDLQKDNTKEIVVTTVDSREILFAPGDYTVATVDSQAVLRGSGKQLDSAGQRNAHPFVGDIPIMSLSTIEARDRRYYILAPIIGAALIGVYLYLHGLKWG